jgi:hypothetical protein
LRKAARHSGFFIMDAATSAVGASRIEALGSPSTWSMPCARKTALPLFGSK